jgi:UDP-glucose 4-epimerase
MKDKTILITGNGSFATAMIERLLKTDVKEIRIFSRNEEKQWQTQKLFNNDRVKYTIGDIREYDTILEATKGVDYVFHSAALKHVPVCEKQPIEAIKTNVIGSQNVMLACIENKVKKVVCLSTDKSANASTCYGATKYLMERLALGIENKDTEIILTRYGNVLGSSGSVIPLFKSLKAQGKPLTITDRDMTRFFMPIEDAIELVLYALENGRHGDLIVHKNKGATIGMIADCISDNQIIVGSRKSEKTDEALLTERELNHSEDLGLYYRVREDIISKTLHTQPLTSDNCEKYSMEELGRLIDEC